MAAVSSGNTTESDVVIVGAGLAGLSAAIELTRAGLSVIVLEAGAKPGGRVRTDLLDGFRLDRGFQLINPAYPQLQRLAKVGALDLDRLQLQSFEAGVRIALAGRHAVLADPRRSPGSALGALAAPGSLAEKAKFVAWALKCGAGRPSKLLAGADEPYGERLSELGIDGPLRRQVLEPFLAGVLGEDSQETSAHFVSLLIRAFVKGTPGVPAWGVQALPDQLATNLLPGTLHCHTPVEGVDGTAVHTERETFTGRAVLVATDPRTAARLTGLPEPAMRALSTFWFVADHAPVTRPILHLDGLRRGPIVNAAVMSAAAPAYSPDGRALIGASVVGLPDDDTLDQVRRQLGLIFDTSAADWELLRLDAIADALPALPPLLTLRQPVQLSETLFVAGDHRDTASQQGALASGARAGRAIRRQLA